MERSLIYRLLRKSGGSGSVVGFLYLLIISLFSYLMLVKSYLIYDIQMFYNEQLNGHFIWLEALYYARNEIYDETFWDLNEETDDYVVLVKLDKNEKSVAVYTKYNEVVRESLFYYNLECHCLFNEKNNDDFVE